VFKSYNGGRLFASSIAVIPSDQISAFVAYSPSSIARTTSGAIQ
jgi:hypothetical protein